MGDLVQRVLCLCSYSRAELSADGWFERKESGFGPFGSDIDVPSDVQGETGGPLQGQNSGELE